MDTDSHQIVQWFRVSFSSTKKSKKQFLDPESWRGHLRHIKGKGGTGSIWGASGKHPPRYSISEVRITPTCQRAKHQRHEPLSRFSGQLFFIHLMIASHLSHVRVSIWLPILTTFGNHCDTNQAAFKTTNSLSFYRFLLTCDDCGTPFLYHWAHF